MLKKIVVSVLITGVLLSGTAFAGLVTPAAPTPQGLKNGSSGSSSSLCESAQSMASKYTSFPIFYDSTKANNFITDFINAGCITNGTVVSANIIKNGILTQVYLVSVK